MKFTMKKILLTLCLASLSSVIYAKNNSDAVSPIVTAGYAGDGALSLDIGLSWKTITIDPQHGQQFVDVLWANNQFVSVGYGVQNNQGVNIIFTSSDGINWINRFNCPLDYNAFFSKVVFINKLYFTLGFTYFYESTDGINWQMINLPSPVPYEESYIRTIAWGNGRYVIAGYFIKNFHHVNSKKHFKNVKYSSKSYDTITEFTATSTDGSNWTIAVQPDGQDFNDLVWTNNQFIAVTYNNVVMTSLDGLAWTPTDQYSPWTVYVNNTFFNYPWGAGNSISISQDGKTWTSSTLPVSNSFRIMKIIYKNNQFMLGGTEPGLNGEVLTSPDGKTWSVMMTDPHNSVDALG